MKSSSSSELEARLRGTPGIHIAQEFFANTAHFLIAIVFLELLRKGAREYIAKPDLYTLLIASVAQAYFLGLSQYARHHYPLIGNLIAPAIYTVIEVAFEGAEFFAAPHHLAYWLFAMLIGALQQARVYAHANWRNALIFVESFARALILLAMIWLYEVLTQPETAALDKFFADGSHVFLALAIVFTGIVSGLANVITHTFQTILCETAEQLRAYSKWVFGRDLLSAAVNDPTVLALQPRERTSLFMDIRGFTQ